jgi:hypothetical protein
MTKVINNMDKNFIYFIEGFYLEEEYNVIL